MRPAVTKLVVLLGFTLGGMAARRAPAQDLSLSYADALARAKAHAIDVRIAKSKSLTAEQARELASYEDDPTIKLSATTGAVYREPPTHQANTDDLTREQSYGLSIGVPLFDFGRQAAREETADGAAKVAAIDADGAEADLRFAVGRAYLDLWSAARTMAVAQQQTQVAQRKLATQTRNYKQGLRPESDVVTAEVDLGRAEIARLNSGEALAAAKARLAELTGSQGDVLATAKPASALAPIVAAWADGGQTPDERRQAAEAEVLSAELAALRARRRPVLDAVLSAEESGTLSPLRTTTSGQLRLTWDVPWSGMGRAEEAGLAKRRETLALQVDATQRARRLTAQLGRDALAASIRLAEALDGQQKLAERQLQLVAKRYEAGQASALEVSTAENTLLTLRLDQIRAGDAAVRAALNVAEAQGVSDLEALFP